MAECVPVDSPARSPLTPDQEAHLSRVTREIVAYTHCKYVDGQRRHGGDLHLKPGMLAHAIDEATDQPVYLHTLAEQMRTLILKCREGSCSAVQAADEIERWLRK